MLEGVDCAFSVETSGRKLCPTRFRSVPGKPEAATPVDTAFELAPFDKDAEANGQLRAAESCRLAKRVVSEPHDPGIGIRPMAYRGERHQGSEVIGPLTAKPTELAEACILDPPARKLHPCPEFDHLRCSLIAASTAKIAKPAIPSAPSAIRAISWSVESFVNVSSRLATVAIEFAPRFRFQFFEPSAVIYLE